MNKKTLLRVNNGLRERLAETVDAANDLAEAIRTMYWKCPYHKPDHAGWCFGCKRLKECTLRSAYVREWWEWHILSKIGFVTEDSLRGLGMSKEEEAGERAAWGLVVHTELGG